MPKYEVRLRSQTDDQSRVVTLSAANEDEARAVCVLAERDVAAYSFDADPYLSDDEAEQISKSLHILDDGKVGPGDKRARGKLHQHLQAKPYLVEGIEVVAINVDRLVRELASLQGDQKAWRKVLDALKKEGVPTAAVTAGQYGVPVKNQWDGTAVTDWDTDTIKGSLHTAYTYAPDTHTFFADAGVSSTEITGTGYTAGGATLGTKTATYDTATDQIRLDAADTSWTTSTLSATDAIVRKDTGVAATSPLIAGIDFGATVSTTAGTFQITWDSTGIWIHDIT